MRSLSRKFNPSSSVIIGVFSLVVFIFGSLLVTQVYAKTDSSVTTGEHLITIHDNGQDRGILTSAATLRLAFEEAGIVVDPNDKIEPGLDSTLVASHYEVNVYRARPVTVVDGAQRIKVMSPYQTPAQIAKHAGITLRDEDTTDMSANLNMVSQGAGLQMTIDRATAFTLVMYGKKVQAYTQAATVGEMLSQKDIKMGDADTLSVSKDTVIVAGMKVELWRNGTQTITEEQAIAFPTEQVQDADRPVGYKKITTPGVKGEKTVSYEVFMKNGKEVKRKEIQSIVTKEPTKQVEVVGTKMTNTFSGDFSGALARLRSCEGSYASNTGNGYYGAYQYDLQTWGNFKGYANASEAPAAVQDEKAWMTYQARGWQPWPSCSRSQGLQDTYR